MGTPYKTGKIAVSDLVTAVRRRPMMYVGDTHGPAGVHNLVFGALREIFDNARAGRGSQVSVTVSGDGSCCIEDNGPALSPASHPREGVDLAPAERLVRATNRLFAGRRTLRPQFHVRQHLSYLRALSLDAEVTAWHDGVEYRASFEFGRHVGAVQSAAASHSQGLRVRFRPDPALFRYARIEYPLVQRQLELLAGLHAGFRTSCRDAATGVSSQFHFSAGLRDFLVSKSAGDRTFPYEPLHVWVADEDMEIEVAVRWNQPDAPGANDWKGGQVRSWVNAEETRGGGTHVDGLLHALHAVGVGTPAPVAFVSLFLPEVRAPERGTDVLKVREVRPFTQSHVAAAMRSRLASDPGLGSQLAAMARLLGVG